MIKITDLTKKYGDFTAVDDIDLEIKQGEIVGLLGPNGAGKTTTMRMMSGYLVPDSGTITYNDMDFTDNEIELKSKISYMPENNPLYEDMLVKEIFELTLNLNKNIPKARWKERIDYALKATDIVDKYYKPIKELSKGYKQRVGLANALLKDPEILILDEPTEGLDPNQRTQIRNLIKEVGKSKTLIISTHVMQEVEAMCDRVIIINNGKIIANGDINEIKNMAKGETIINIEIDSKDLLRDFQELDFVKNVKVGSNKQNAQYQITVSKNSKTDEKEIYAEISQILLKNKAVIYKLQTAESKLEDVFFSLTKD